MAGEDLPGAELDLPVAEALERGVRAIIEECVENTVTSRAIRRRVQGITDDRNRQELRRADDYDGDTATIAKFFDRFMPSPAGEPWQEVIDERADVLEEERLADVEG